MEPEKTGTYRTPWPMKSRLVLGVGVCALALAGCSSGTLTGVNQNCESSGGFLSADRISCSGGARTAKGEPSLEIIDADGDFSGTYRLRATISVGEGAARANLASTSGDGAGGTLSPDRPLELDATVSLDEEDDDVSVSLDTGNREVRDIVYEATLIPAE